MKRQAKKYSIMIAMVMMFILFATSCGHTTSNSKNSVTFDSQSQSQNTDNFETQVQHITSVPDGYIGIYTADDLQNIKLNPNANYILMNDIDLSGYVFESLYYESGTFNGNNYSIKNYSGNDSLFRRVENVAIENLVMSNASIENTNPSNSLRLGGIIGRDNLNTSGSLKNCSFDGTISITVAKSMAPDTYFQIGGLVGCLIGDDWIIEDCNFTGTIALNVAGTESAECEVGGIIGSTGVENSTKINRCASRGHIQCTSSSRDSTIGGICGFLSENSSLVDSFNATNVEVYGTGRYIGGVIGHLQGRGNHLYNIGKIQCDTENVKIGAITGTIYYGELQYCYYSNDISEAVGDGTPFANVAALSLPDMQKEESFYGFDFVDTWEMGKGDYSYPVLRALNN